MAKLTLIKIGGSLITDKSRPFTIKPRALRKICLEIKKAWQPTTRPLIVGHGAGSYAHVPAKKYGTIDGFSDNQGRLGSAIVQDTAARLNRLVIQELINRGLPAVSLPPSAFVTSSAKNPGRPYLDTLLNLLDQGMLPVVYGDVVSDTKIGSTIFSTEKVLNLIAAYLPQRKYQVEQILHCGLTEGVYDKAGQTLPRIDRHNWSQVKKLITGSGGIDVTGGMLHKVEEAIIMAKKGIPALIIDGIESGSLSQALAGQAVVGTRISW